MTLIQKSWAARLSRAPPKFPPTLSRTAAAGVDLLMASAHEPRERLQEGSVSVAARAEPASTAATFPANQV